MKIHSLMCALVVLMASAGLSIGAEPTLYQALKWIEESTPRMCVGRFEYTFESDGRTLLGCIAWKQSVKFSGSDFEVLGDHYNHMLKKEGDDDYRAYRIISTTGSLASLKETDISLKAINDAGDKEYYEIQIVANAGKPFLTLGHRHQHGGKFREEIEEKRSSIGLLFTSIEDAKRVLKALTYVASQVEKEPF